MSYILYALCILYGTYGIVFCSKLCFLVVMRKYLRTNIRDLYPVFESQIRIIANNWYSCYQAVIRPSLELLYAP